MTRLVVGLLILCGALQGAASALGSTHGEWGGVVALLVVGAGLLTQRLLHHESWKELGLAAPTGRGVWTALCLAAMLLVAAMIYALIAGAAAKVVPGARWLLVGMLAQGGIAEELVFRGYLFGHIRRTRPFWTAALISAIPFALVHLTLFLTLPWAIALTALVMSVAMTFPLSWLYELGGRTIWAPAVLHTVLQAVPKLITPDDATFQIAWMVGGMIVAWSAFAVRREKVRNYVGDTAYRRSGHRRCSSLLVEYATRLARGRQS
jgi:membrane protease YdiL (CAAX protease family)